MDKSTKQPVLSGRDQFKRVSTGNGFSNDLAATNIDRLELTVIELQNLQKNNSEQTQKLGKLLESLDDSILYLQGDIKVLIRTISEANAKNDKLQLLFLIFTIIGVIFAATGIIQAWDILVRGIGK